jgi:hypothetical protein
MAEDEAGGAIVIEAALVREECEAKCPIREEWESKHRKKHWLRENVKEIFRNACNAVTSSYEIPAKCAGYQFVVHNFRTKLRVSFWKVYLEGWNGDVVFLKTGSKGASKLDQMTRALNSVQHSDKRSFFRDLEKWEHAIKDLNPEWKDFFCSTVFPVIGVSASVKEDKKLDNTDDAKAQSIYEIRSEEERHEFLRFYRCVHTRMQDPHEEDGEPPLSGDHPRIASLGLLSRESKNPETIKGFHFALKQNKPRVVRFDASDIFTTELQERLVRLVETHGLNDYSNRSDTMAFPQESLRIVPIWSLTRLKRVDRNADASQNFFKYVSVAEYDMGRVHVTGSALKDLVKWPKHAALSQFVTEIFEKGSTIYRNVHSFVAAGDKMMSSVDSNLSTDNFSILCSRNLPEEDAVQVETFCDWCVGGGKKVAGGGGGGAEAREEGDSVGANAAEACAGRGGRAAAAEAVGGGKAAAAEGSRGGGAAAAEGGGGGGGGAAAAAGARPPPRPR